MALFFECMPMCARKRLDTADIVRDGDVSSTAYSNGELDVICTWAGRVIALVSAQHLVQHFSQRRIERREQQDVVGRC